MAEDAAKEKDKEKEHDKEKGKDAKPATGIKKLLGNKILVIAIAGVLVLGIGAGGYLVFASKSEPKAEGEEASRHEEPAPSHGGGGGSSHGKDEKPKGALEQGFGGQIFGLDPFVVNLQDNSGTRYLKVTINLEITGNGTTEELEAQTAKVRDAVIVLLSSKSYADIGTVEGKYQMRDEVVERVNQFLRKSHVKTAYFTDFVIQ